MRFLAIVFGIVAFGTAGAQSLADSLKSDSLPVHRVGLVVGKARQQLAAAWNDSSGVQVERAYCVTQWHQIEGVTHAIQIYVVSRIAEPDTVLMANQIAIVYGCSTGLPTIHIHPPVTCRQVTPDGVPVPSSCTYGGVNAWLCAPSPKDMLTWLDANILAPFNIIQCDRNAFMFFWVEPSGKYLTINSR